MRYRVVRCTHHDPAEPGPRRVHWHIEWDGNRTDMRFDSPAEAETQARKESR